jgi:hypothetical protein
MISEMQLASTFIQMGRERGLTTEQVVEQLAAVALPAFVDQSAFRSSLLSAVEDLWHAELESRLQRLRQRMQLEAHDGSPTSVPATPALGSDGRSADVLPLAGATTRAETENIGSEVAAASMAPGEPMPGENEASPKDATLFWSTNGD